MAIVTANSSLQLGLYKGDLYDASIVIDSPSAGVALPFLADFTGNITRVALFISSLIDYVFDPDFRQIEIISTDITNLNVGIMGSNVIGDLPSDIFLATPNTISIVASPPPLYYTINLDNAVPVVKGNVYWIVYKPNASFTGSLVVSVSSGSSGKSGLWKVANRTSSTWSRSYEAAHVMYGSNTRWYSNDVPVHPVAKSIGPVISGKEYGFSFTLKSDHPAIRISNIDIDAISFYLISNINVTLKVRSQAGDVLHTFATYNTDSIANSGVLTFYGNEFWLESNTKYYLMLVFDGTFTSDLYLRNFIYDPTWDDADGAFTSNYAERLSDGTITETTSRYSLFKIYVDSVRFDDTQKDIYINASPMFSGGFSG